MRRQGPHLLSSNCSDTEGSTCTPEHVLPSKIILSTSKKISIWERNSLLSSQTLLLRIVLFDDAFGTFLEGFHLLYCLFRA